LDEACDRLRRFPDAQRACVIRDRLVRVPEGEQGVATREIAEVIGKGLGVPVVSLAAEEALEHFGFLARFFGADCPASSAQTQEQLGWQPAGPGLIEDLAQHYFRG